MSAGVLEEIVAGHLRGIPRMNVEQFERYMSSGLAGENVRCELLDGYPILRNCAATGDNPMIMGARHPFVVDAMNSYLARYLAGSIWSHKCQTPIELDDFNLLEPDLTIIRGRSIDYAPGYPRAEAIALIIEVADSSLEADRITKYEKYARHGIPVYWIINLRDQQLEIYENPAAEQSAYLKSVILPANGTVKLGIAELSIQTLSVHNILEGTV